MEAIERKRGRGLSILLTLLGVVYPMGIACFLLAWADLQGLAGEWSKEALPLYALACTLGTLGIFAIMQWKRVGVYGLAAAWLATAILNLIYAPPSNPAATITALLLIAILMFEIRGVWRFLT